MNHKNEAKGTSVWIGTNNISDDYFDGNLNISPNDLVGMIRNSGGANALRGLAHTCIILPMINNRTGVSPEYRTVINNLNAIAKKYPECFNENIWIQAFQQIIDALSLVISDDSSEVSEDLENKSLETKQVTEKPAQQQATQQKSAPLADNRDTSDNAFENPVAAANNDELKKKFNNF